MPIFEYVCSDCGQTSEILLTSTTDRVKCTSCGSRKLKKLFSAHAAVSGSSASHMPGPGDTACCGSSPGQANCAGPGSCCGKNH
ncbi:MAG: zinc ribbon domain-containing protein [Deltaproteobacteria bacterium]|nr:MAG: zinc ribbon domain-containing protein [Deltaproteobacteria bacterium]HHE75129.1 zinc ribbon domain-containing protein [Desulfobacteraceae bacterium]